MSQVAHETRTFKFQNMNAYIRNVIDQPLKAMDIKYSSMISYFEGLMQASQGASTATTDSIWTTLRNLQTSVGNVDDRLQVLYNFTHKDVIDLIDETDRKIDRKITEVGSRITDEVNALNTTITSKETDLRTLISTNITDIAALKRSSQAFETSVQTVQRSVTALSTSHNELDTWAHDKYTEVSSSLTSHTTTLTTHTNDIARLKTDLTSLTTTEAADHTSEVQARTALASRVTSAENTISSHGTRITTLENSQSKVFTGATSSKAGTSGLVPVPPSGSTNWVLSGGSTWFALKIAKTLAVADLTKDGLMLAEDKTKLDSIAANANNYVLPTATGTILGGVTVGSNITLSSGKISVTKANVIAALGYTPLNQASIFEGATSDGVGVAGLVPAPPKGTGTTYFLKADGSWAIPPTVSTSIAGYMSPADKTKLDGIATGANKYVLPTATGSVLGGVTIGNNITSTSGKISVTKANVLSALGLSTVAPTDVFTGATATSAGTSGLVPSPAKETQDTYFLKANGTWAVPPLVTTTSVGYMSAGDKAKLDGIAAEANKYVLPTASSILGGVKTSSTVSSTVGLTPTPIISGIPYYKYPADMIGATASVAGSAGLVPAPATGQHNFVLTGSGLWKDITSVGQPYTTVTADGGQATVKLVSPAGTDISNFILDSGDDIKIEAALNKITFKALHRQSYTARTTNTEYPLLGGFLPATTSASGSDIETTSGSVSFTSGASTSGNWMTMNPATGTIRAKTFQGAFSGNATTATTLQTARTLWGNSFNGSANISGVISGAPSIELFGSSTNGGYLDFHYAGSTSDYTSRIIESTTGQIVINKNTKISSSLLTTPGTLGIQNQFTKGEYRSQPVYWTVALCDNLGTNYTTNCLGLLETSVSQYGLVSTYLKAMKNEASSSTNAQLAVFYDSSNDTSWATCPTPTKIAEDGTNIVIDTALNNTKIATTAWVRAATGNTSLNSATTTKLATARSLWGNSFNGTSDITGTIKVTGTQNQFIASYEGYHLLIRNNGTNSYLLISEQNEDPGTFTSARPLTIVNATGICSINGNAATATTFESAKKVTLTGDVTGEASSRAGWEVATTLKDSGVVAGNYGPSSNLVPGYGNTFSVPYFTVDAKGRVTSASTKIITMPDAQVFADSQVTSTKETTTKAYLTGTTSSTTTTGSLIFDTGIYTTTTAGELVATTFKGALIGNVTGSVSGSSGSCTGNAATATQFASNQTVTLTGDVTGSASSQASWYLVTTLKDSGATAGSYGPATNVSPDYRGTFAVPYLTVDAKGRVTSISSKTITLPENPNTDTRVTNTLNTTQKAYITGTTAASTNTGTQVFDTGVFLTANAGELQATTFKGNLVGNVTGNISGSSGSCSGNAESATKLAVARSIWGNSFNGTDNVTGVVKAPAMDLSGLVSTNGGYINFHFNNSAEEYTSRITESASGTLTINGITVTGSTITGNLSGIASNATQAVNATNATTATKVANPLTIASTTTASNVGVPNTFNGSASVTAYLVGGNTSNIENFASTANDVSVTGWCKLYDGTIINYGRFSGSGATTGTTVRTVSFPVGYISGCTVIATVEGSLSNQVCSVQSVTKTSAVIFSNGSGLGFKWIAIGR